MQKSVQIPYELFLDLLRFHLFDIKDNENRIQTGLERKMNALYDRELYGKYKSAEDESEREELRQRYLDRRGISENFRW